MSQESRIKKTLLNARVNLIFYFLTLALSFFSRKIFLDCLGADFIGLTGTLLNLLGFLNLAELGIGSAIGYVLYKPLFDHDQEKINEIISVMGYLYRWIGLFILGGGCLLACFLPWIFPDTQFDLSLIYFAYFSFLASSLIGYFINYRQSLLGADQRNYVVTAYFQTTNIIKTIIQMTTAYYTGSYYLWVAIELTFGIIYSLILNWKINETYPWLKTEINNGRKLMSNHLLIIRNTKRIFLHKIGIVTQWQALPILIYAFESLKLVAFYENYSMLATKITSLINSVMGSSEAAVGNLIAEGNKLAIERVLWEMITIRFWVCGGLILFLYKVLPPFIVLWLGREYLLPEIILILLIVKISIESVQSCLGQFIYGFGLFDDVWATLTQAVIFLVGAIIGGTLWGLAGILGASILSVALWFGLWKPYYLYHFGMKLPLWKFWKQWFIVLIQLFASLSITLILEKFILLNPEKNYISLIGYSSLLYLSYLIISFTILITMNEHTKHLWMTFYNKIKRNEFKN